MSSEDLLQGKRFWKACLSKRQGPSLSDRKSDRASLCQIETGHGSLSGEETAREMDTAFLEAFMADGSHPSLRPSGSWSASRLPGLPCPGQSKTSGGYRPPHIREALVYVSGRTRIRAALGLDQEGVQSAFERSTSAPALDLQLESVPDRMRLILSGFPTGSNPCRRSGLLFLTLTETVGAAILALPIALARWARGRRFPSCCPRRRMWPHWFYGRGHYAERQDSLR